MSDFTVTVPDVTQTSVATHAAGAELAEELRALRREVDAVLGGHWRGAAATAFDHCWGDWHAGACEVIAALDRLGELLADAAHSYETYEDGATSRLRGSGAALTVR